MEIFSLQAKSGQTLMIDGNCLSELTGSFFQDGPIEILFCRISEEKIVLSIKAPSSLNIFLSDVANIDIDS